MNTSFSVSLNLDACNITRHCDQVAGILLGSHVGWLHVLQDGPVIFGNGVVGCVFLDKVVCLFLVQTQ